MDTNIDVSLVSAGHRCGEHSHPDRAGYSHACQIGDRRNGRTSEGSGQLGDLHVHSSGDSQGTCLWEQEWEFERESTGLIWNLMKHRRTLEKGEYGGNKDHKSEERLKT